MTFERCIEGCKCAGCKKEMKDDGTLTILVKKFPKGRVYGLGDIEEYYDILTEYVQYISNLEMNGPFSTDRCDRTRATFCKECFPTEGLSLYVTLSRTPIVFIYRGIEMVKKVSDFHISTFRIDSYGDVGHMKTGLIEYPLREFYTDELDKIKAALGIPMYDGANVKPVTK